MLMIENVPGSCSRRIRICGESEFNIMMEDGSLRSFLERCHRRWFSGQTGANDMQRIIKTKNSHAFHDLCLKDAATVSRLREAITILEIGESKALMLKTERTFIMVKDGWTDCGAFPDEGSPFRLMSRAVKNPRERVKIRFGEF